MKNEISLKQISERLGMPIGQLHERDDVLRRCELINLSFKQVESMLVDNGMLADLVHSESELPF